ncbi:MAG: hypothetical protein HOK52_11215 [Candidatus Marinimicrobia bacterium]|jgi:hypothetical protein|nr:hypothetical protein [Candidatus Neomarinimicrobiota bacterium]
MDTPLIGSRETNYKFFYGVGVSTIISFLLLIIITSYSASIIGDVELLIKDMHIVLQGVKELLPEAKFGADMLNLLCQNKNFTNYYRNVRPICVERH